MHLREMIYRHLPPLTLMLTALLPLAAGAADALPDVAHHPAAAPRFFDMRPDQGALKLAPDAGWHTESLAPQLREHDKFYVAHASVNSSGRGMHHRRVADDQCHLPIPDNLGGGGTVGAVFGLAALTLNALTHQFCTHEVFDWETRAAAQPD
jgi:hypothetical protein